jgi:hypothetical protein
VILFEDRRLINRDTGAQAFAGLITTSINASKQEEPGLLLDAPLLPPGHRGRGHTLAAQHAPAWDSLVDGYRTPDWFRDASWAH